MRHRLLPRPGNAAPGGSPRWFVPENPEPRLDDKLPAIRRVDDEIGSEPADRFSRANFKAASRRGFATSLSKSLFGLGRHPNVSGEPYGTQVKPNPENAG